MCGVSSELASKAAGPQAASMSESAGAAAHRASLRLVLGALLLAGFPRGLDAQSAARDTTGSGLATLAIWADGVWLALADRDGSYFGRLADQGTFQRFNPLMDTEYELDLATGLFSPSEEARWSTAVRGLRVVGASINHPFILNFAEWREMVPVSGPVDLHARFVRQKSLTTQRDYPVVGVRWRRLLGSPWALRTTIGMHFFKPSADVEVGLVRGWGGSGGGGGRLTLDLGVALLDAFNNVIYNALGVEPQETPAHFNYTALPVAARLALRWSSPSRSLELKGGVSTRSEVRVSFPASGEPSYSLAEQVSFVGALAEAALAPRVRVAAYGTMARAATDRRFTPPRTDDLRLREKTQVLGLRGRVTHRRALALELDLRGTWRPEDRLSGDGSSVRHRDREVFGLLALVRQPATGWTWRLGYAFMDRDAGVLASRLSAVNHRQLMEWGYRFRSGFEATAGLRWDLDRGFAGPFDGGHVRFAATW